MLNYYTFIFFVLGAIGLSSCTTSLAKEVGTDDYFEIKECPSPVCEKIQDLQHFYFKPIHKKPTNTYFNLEECIIRL